MYNKIKNILVIKLRYLGDVVVTTPVFKELRYHYPKAFIAALVNKGTEAMLTQNPDIDKLLVLEKYKNPVLNFIKQIGLINILRGLHFDLVLELTANDRGAFLGFMSGAKRRVGFKPAKMKKLDRRLLFTDLITPNEKEHIIEHHLRMIKHLGYFPLRKDLSLYWSKEDETDCQQVLRKKGLSLNDHFVVLHPILQARYRAWRIEGYAAICDYLQKKWNVRTILICGNYTDEIGFVNKIVEKSESPPVHLGGQLSLKQLPALLSHAMLFIGIDSGPMHMAAAVKTPVVAIFGPQDRFRWGPWGEGHTVIQKSWDCVPCYNKNKGCNGKGGSKCLDAISVEEVTSVLEPKMELILNNRCLHSSRA